jgi:hypothetical protein
MIELSRDEREYLLELLETSHRQLVRELNHTDASKFGRVLREKLEVNERLTARISCVPEWVVP